jgi:hypothetical protein
MIVSLQRGSHRAKFRVAFVQELAPNELRAGVECLQNVGREGRDIGVGRLQANGSLDIRQSGLLPDGLRNTRGQSTTDTFL